MNKNRNRKLTHVTSSNECQEGKGVVVKDYKRYFNQALLFPKFSDDVTQINFRFRHLVMRSSPYGCVASPHKIWSRYHHSVRRH